MILFLIFSLNLANSCNYPTLMTYKWLKMAKINYFRVEIDRKGGLKKCPQMGKNTSLCYEILWQKGLISHDPTS